MGLHPSSDIKQGLTIVNELWMEYQDALPLGEGLEKTEMQYGDEFVILASHILLDLYTEHQESAFLIQAIALLEIALVKSIHNFQIKLILVRMYTMIGNLYIYMAIRDMKLTVSVGVYKRSFEIYRTMEIKQIQFDTMM